MSLLRAAFGGIALSVGISVLAVGASAPARAQGREAAVSLQVGDAARGDKADVTVNMTVNRKSISLRRLFVTVRCKEIVDFPYTVPEEKDSKGKVVTPAKSLRVTKEEILFEREFTIVAGQDLAANSHHKFKGDIEIPGKPAAVHEGQECAGQMGGLRWNGYSRHRRSREFVAGNCGEVISSRRRTPVANAADRFASAGYWAGAFFAS